MRRFYQYHIIILVILICCAGTARGQLSGTKTIPGTYASISAAIAALNAAGVGAGGVTFNIAPNYVERITGTLSISLTTNLSTAANPIVFQRTPATIGGNPKIISYTTGTATTTSATQDGIWRLLGVDYITIDGIDLKDSSANINNLTAMEYGYALYKKSTSDGCQNVTIKNCTITLNRVNFTGGVAPMVDGSTGIIVMNATATAATTNLTPVAGGNNANNKFYSNTIQNCNTGIALIGYVAPSPYTLADTSNDVGGSSIATGNTIINFGGGANPTTGAIAIRTLAQYKLNVSYNTINNNNGSGVNHASSLRGIYLNTAVSASETITNNTITLKGGGTTQNIIGIDNIAGATPAGNTVNISYNTITNCTYTTGTTGTTIYISNSANPTTLAINNNTISNNSSSKSTALLSCISNSGAATNATINNNIITGTSTAKLTTALFCGIHNSGSGTNLSINNNVITNSSTTATSGAYYAIYNTGAVSSTININGNSIGDDTSDALTFAAGSSATEYIIYNNTTGISGCALSISNNSIKGLTITGNGTGPFTLISNTAATLSQNINNNKFRNLSINTSVNVTFIANDVALSATGTQNINGNSIVGTFAKTRTGGSVTVFSSSAASASGAVKSHNNNNFSNISVLGAATITGWSVTDTGRGTKNIQNDTFSYWTGATGIITAMSVSLGATSANNSVSGNLIRKITNGPNITAIAITGGNNNIFNNIIDTVSTTSNNATINGISLSTGLTNNVYNNTTRSLVAAGTGTTINAIYLSGTTNNVYSNTIQSLSMGYGTFRGIYVSGTTNSVYNNTINTLTATATNTTTINGIELVSVTADTVYNNIIHTLTTTGNATIQGISLSGAAAHTAYGNTIHTLTTAMGTTVNGIILVSGTTSNLYSNTIHTLTTSANSTLNGIGITASTTVSIYKNKIYNLQGGNTSTSGSLSGILISSITTTANIHNNIIGDLRMPVANATSDILRGISLVATNANSSINIYYNTIFLNAVSTGARFSTTGIFHTTSGTAATAKLDLRNNIIINTSTPNGTGLTVAYRRSSNALGNYATTSNNNLFYAGDPATNRLIFYDGANSDQVMSTYKIRVLPRDSSSITEDLTTKFKSVIGSTDTFLHIDPSQATQVEGRAANIATYTTDFDGDIRQGNPGYPGFGSAPDIGADEFNGEYSAPLSGTYTVGVGGDFTSLTQGGGLFSIINQYGLSGNTIVNIISNLDEDGANALNQWKESPLASNYTLTIRPNAATIDTISGDALTGMIVLNGADRVTIDGSVGGVGNYLLFRNTNAAGTTASAFTFINGATGNTIKYCDIQAYTNATTGTILFSTSTAATGNNSNLITNCNVNSTVGANTGYTGIYSAGTTSKENTSNTISSNNIYNHRDRGLDITATGSTTWTINDNSFYNGSVSGAIAYVAASALHGIRILGGAGYTIQDNFIGGSTALATGSNAAYNSTGFITYQGILLTTTSASPASNIKGNTIAKITLSCVPTATATTNMFSGIETSGSGITIGGSLTGEGNMIGSNSSNSSISITTNSGGNNRKTNVFGINSTSTGGTIVGNQVGSIDIQNIGNTSSSSNFYGIMASAATAPTSISNNIIGSTGIGAASNSIRVVASSISTTTTLTGIALAATVASTVQVSNNRIQNLGYLNTASATGAAVTGISNAAITPAVITISNDTITATSINAGGALYGINNSGTATTVTITGNSISGNTSTATVAGLLYGIYSTGTGTTTNITNNLISKDTTGALTTGLFVGIYNAGTTGTLNVTGNTLFGNSTSATSGVHYSIYNTANVTTAININSNNIGTGTGVSSAITFSAANSGTQIGITNTGGGASSVLKIKSNNFQGINYATAGSGSYTLISNTVNTKYQNIDSNLFTNLSINTTGNITFIANSVVVSGADTQTVNANSISGTFTKAGAGGTLTLYTSTAQNGNTAKVFNSNNNFSNITVSGATIIAGWVNTDAGGAAKYIQNNTFSNWTGGSGAITAMTTAIVGTTNAISNNTIKSISSSGAITGITSGAGNDNIFSNTIDTLSSSGTVAVTAITVTAGTLKKIYKNKIFDLQSGGATGTVNGILVSGTATTTNIYNNLIGGLRVPAGNNGTTDVIRGISITTTSANTAINVYYNTIYLNATSSGAGFSTSGIFHTVSGTATTAALTLRNNIIANYSTPGTGITAALRRSATATLTNFLTASNNNLLYVGTTGTTRLIYYDGSTTSQSLANYKSTVGPTRESAAVTEDVATNFLTTAGSSSSYLHINPSANPVSLAKSKGAVISGYTDDYDGQTRVSPTDIGADEIIALEILPPTITYTALTNTTGTTNRTLSSVTITDPSTVNVTAGTRPRIYYKRLSDANTVVDNTTATNGWKYTETSGTTSPFSFTIDYSLLYGGATSIAGTIQYFVVAQDQVFIPNVGINSGDFTNPPATVALTATAFPIIGTINSYNLPFSGSYNVGATEIFTSLTKTAGIFAQVNAAGLAGNVTFNITSDLAEDGTNTLNQWTETPVSSNYKLVIQPNSSTLRTISGDAINGLIRFNGADRVKIDGSNGTGNKYLAFKNTNTAGTTGTAFRFSNGSANDTIRYCSAEAFANDTTGVIQFGASVVSGGNSSNQITNCDIIATTGGNTSNVGIYSSGIATFENASNSITNNNIYNYRDRGIDIKSTGNTTWTISGNSFYNGGVSGTISYTAGSTLHGIRILGGSGYTILNNYIGGNAAGATGTNAVFTSSGNLSYQGILLTTTNALPASTIKGNTIGRISLSAVPTAASANTFIGIETNGSGITIGGSLTGEGNTIGANTDSTSISVLTTTTNIANTSIIRGISCNSTSTLIIGNQVGGFNIRNVGTAPAASTFTGIYVNSALANSITSNIIGSSGVGAASNSICVPGASTALATVLNGITIGPSVASTVSLNGNIIKNISNLSTTSSGSFTGINNTGAAASTLLIFNNSIAIINGATNSNASSTTYTGISCIASSSITANVISNINLPATGTAAQIIGIRVSGAFAYTISNDTLSSFNTASTKTADIQNGTPANFSIIGILDEASTTSQTISGNNLSGFNATSAAATNTVAAGIAVTNASAVGNIYNNKINALINAATGTATYPGIGGIIMTNGTFNVYNNSINLSNGNNTNGVRIYGINHVGTNSCNYFYNSVYISGISNAVTRSTAFMRNSTGTVSLKNNLFVNVREGNGTNFAISNIASPATTGWSATASNYNELYSTTAANTGEWVNGSAKTFATWQSSSLGDANSINRSITLVNATTNVQPDSNTNCFLNNKGTPITTPVSITTDITGLSRSASTPDIGAYEFNFSQFIVDAGSNSPICAGGDVSLTTDIGAAIDPTYSWRNPLFTTVATTQNPDVTAITGNYKVTITDINGCIGTDSVAVTVNARPTAHFTASVSSLCEGSSADLNLTVTGTGTITGTTSEGDDFSGTAPSIVVEVSPDITTRYFIANLSDDNCAAIAPVDLPDSVLIRVTHAGDWLGVVSNDWNNPANWCGGIPSSSTNVNIDTGATYYPTISTGAAYSNDLSLNTGTSLTVSNASLDIYGNINSNGTFTATTAAIGLDGDSTQYIPANLFAGNTISDLTINNTDSVLLGGTLNITSTVTPLNGIFHTGNFLKLISTASKTALIDGSTGSGSVIGNVTIQRYLASSFGYKYISSPFDTVTVAQLGSYVNLNDTFPTLYQYNENKVSSGWENYTSTSGILNPLQGYAANLGTAATPTTLQLKGVVNNGTITTTLYNHNQTYTQGFNLVGNPYPSPIDWNASSGITRNNIDNAVYYFNASTTDQYGGTYSSYINGISSDGVANNIIPAMQGFFVHVTNGTYPVTASLTFDNPARINNYTPTFHRLVNYQQQPLIRLGARLGDDATIHDAMVVYFDDSATGNYDQQFDALKLLNTDAAVPNIYAAVGDTKLSINAIATPGSNSSTNVPLTVEVNNNGPVTFSANDILRMPYGLHAYVADAATNQYRNLETSAGYRVELDAGKYENRFYLIFSHDDVITIPGTAEQLIAYNKGQSVFVYMSGEQGTIVIYNTIGQAIAQKEVTGKGYHEVTLTTGNNMYIITLYTEKGKLSKKMFIGHD